MTEWTIERNPNSAQRALIRHLIAHGLEGCDVVDSTPDDVEWEYRGWEAEYISWYDDGTVEVCGSQQQDQQRLHRRATLYNPPEYKRFEGTVYCVVVCDFTDDTLAGETSVTLEYEGGVSYPGDWV